MDWETRLSRYCGRQVEVVIEDLVGADPLAPPATRTLHHVRLTDEQTHVQCYFNDTQFLSIPVFDDLRTCMEEAAEETVFISHDEAGKLIYKLRLCELAEQGDIEKVVEKLGTLKDSVLYK